MSVTYVDLIVISVRGNLQVVVMQCSIGIPLYKTRNHRDSLECQILYICAIIHSEYIRSLL